MNLTKAVGSLQVEKKWIDNLIRAVEIAATSPQNELVSRIARLLHDRNGRGLIFLSARSKAELSRLADSVHRGSRLSSSGPHSPPKARRRLPEASVQAPRARAVVALPAAGA